MGVIDSIKDKAREIASGVRDVRRPHNFRHLAAGEKAIAYKVFEGSIPYSRVLVSDGLGYNGRPFTLPEFTHYVLHVGDGYYGMSSPNRLKDQGLLIHELVHVWQGEHSRWRGTYAIESLWAQRHGDDAYTYDPAKLKDWDSYNPEQQAQIVEDWFTAGSLESDTRYWFIRCHIRGKCTADPPPLPPVGAEFTRIGISVADESRIPSDVLFAFDSARLKPEAHKYLQQAVPTLNKWAKGYTVVIEGHTDSTGSFGYNMRLSRERAQAVKRALIGLGADNAANFNTKGFGESRPLLPNTTRENRRKNRRVEFRYE